MKRSRHHVPFPDVHGSMLPLGILECITATRLRAYDLPNRSIRSDGSDEEEVCRAPLI
jgi:hypothetical protein